MDDQLPEDGTHSGSASLRGENTHGTEPGGGLRPPGTPGTLGDPPVSGQVYRAWEVTMLAKRPATQAMYHRFVDAYLATVKRPVSKLSDLELTASVQMYLNSLPGYSSRRLAIAAIRSLLRQCNRTVTVDLGMKVAPRTIIPLTPEEVLGVVAQARTPHERALLLVMVDTGGRAGALCASNVGDVSWDDGCLVLRAEVSKNGLESRAPLSEAALDAVRVVSKDRKDDEPLFLNAMGRRFSAHYLWEVVRKRARDAGVKKRVYPHLFRHQRALAYRTGGTETDTVLNAMGWANAQQYNSRYGRRSAASTVAEARASLETAYPVRVVREDNDTNRRVAVLEAEIERLKRSG